MTSEWIALVVARWLNFAAVAGLFGMSLFPLYAPERARCAFCRRPAAWALMFAGGILTLASTFGWAGATLVAMAGDLSELWDGDAWSSFLFETSFGPAWILRGVLAVAIMTLLVVTRAQSANAAVALLSAALLVSQAWIGHAASLAAPARWFVTLAYAFHVAGAGVWFGGLLSLILVMRELDGSTGSDNRVAEDLLIRFSSVGLVAVFVIIAAGIVNVLAYAPASPAVLLSSHWGQSLSAKLTLVGGMLALAFLNRFVLMPRLARGEASALPLLTRSVVIEQLVGLAVLAVTAALGVMDPLGQ